MTALCIQLWCLCWELPPGALAWPPTQPARLASPPLTRSIVLFMGCCTQPYLAIVSE